MRQNKYKLYWLFKGYHFGIYKENDNKNILYSFQKTDKWDAEDMWFVLENEYKNFGFNKMDFPKGGFTSVRIYDSGKIQID